MKAHTNQHRHTKRRSWFNCSEAARQFGVNAASLHRKAKLVSTGDEVDQNGIKFTVSHEGGRTRVSPVDDRTCVVCSKALTKYRTRVVNGKAACYTCHLDAFGGDEDARRALDLPLESLAELNSGYK